jgi:transposase
VIETAINYKDLYEQTLVLYHQSIDAHTNTMLQITTLRHELDNLKRMIFGSKNERFIPTNSTSSQLSLDMQADAVAQCNVTKAQKIEYIRHTTEVTKDHP